MTVTEGRLVPARVRGWAVWTASPALICWIAATVLVAVALTAVGGVTTPAHPSQLVTWLVLLGCVAVSVEALHRSGQPAGVVKDLLSVWTLPVALLLPPVYSLLIPVPLMLLRQHRLARALVFRRVYSAAAIGLANWVVSVAFHRCLQWGAAHPLGSPRFERVEVLALALACAGVGCAVNVVLIGQAVRLSSPEATWRDLLLNREQRVLDVVEICLGVAVAGCWVVTPALAVVMLVPMVLVQRGLNEGQLRAAARIDAKTGLLNAKAWQGEAEREIVRAHREKAPLAVLIADLDNFKRVNDTYGHLGGDVALIAAVTALHTGLRTYDQLGRFGGEEFTVVLPRTGHAEAERIADRLCRAVAAAPVVLDGSVVNLSVSIGVAVLREHGQDLTDLLTAADHALYQAKGSGRNQVAIAP